MSLIDRSKDTAMLLEKVVIKAMYPTSLDNHTVSISRPLRSQGDSSRVHMIRQHATTDQTAHERTSACLPSNAPTYPLSIEVCHNSHFFLLQTSTGLTLRDIRAREQIRRNPTYGAWLVSIPNSWDFSSHSRPQTN
ncbi:uncharacterized protein MYCFIDRAFT_175333 [Pseudocercospora fijiensis CIRAD86]|uniref:Uncharacterized protein n=1 Tax=Pseudocercospora fijiensis (strain CIRAD86) TaxID=383855 RepID=M3AB16_PSEFD|nr:uncharacterized protein MYCFIDRAFT_175333 [Pseudocercospora fijiensis CIRAD86]EME81756.1 hypothetical protein MYCFIDRAFT_175333 [Pseudocercospora fijiensis CIRAD86]